MLLGHPAVELLHRSHAPGSQGRNTREKLLKIQLEIHQVIQEDENIREKKYNGKGEGTIINETKMVKKGREARKRQK